MAFLLLLLDHLGQLSEELLVVSGMQANMGIVTYLIAANVPLRHGCDFCGG